MKKNILFVCIILLASANSLFCQYWQEQIVLKGNVITQCFDENEDVLFSSELSNGKFAVCRYSVEKDSMDKVLLVTTNAVEFLEVLTDGTIMAFQNYQFLKSTDKGDSWVGIKNDIMITEEFQNNVLKEFNGSLILKKYDCYVISYDKGSSWDILKFENNKIILIEPTYNGCLVGVENNKKYPIFSSDFGKTWVRTNLDSLRLFNFIYSEISKTIFALSWDNQRNIYKSDNAGKTWQKIEIPVDTIIGSFDVESTGNLIIMDSKNNLYKYLTRTSELEIISNSALFRVSRPAPYFGERYRIGVFLSGNDDILYYDIHGFKLYKYNKIAKQWTDSLDILMNETAPSFLLRNCFKYSRPIENLIVNAKDIGLFYISLISDKLIKISIPNGTEPITEYYDLGANGEMVFVDYKIKYYDKNGYSKESLIEYLLARFSISKDQGFSRQIFYKDTCYYYSNKIENNLPDRFDFLKFGFNNKNDFIIIGNNQVVKFYENFHNKVVFKNDNLNNYMPILFGISPDSLLYLFFSEIVDSTRGFHISDTIKLFWSSNNGISWETNFVDFIKDSISIKPDNIQFYSDGTIFITDRESGLNSFYSSSDHCATWNKYSIENNFQIRSLYIDNRDNLYYNFSDKVNNKHYTNKNGVTWGDTTDVVVSRFGHIFANIYLDDYGFRLSIYSSDYGSTWKSIFQNYDFDIKTATNGDVYQYPKFPSVIIL